MSQTQPDTANRVPLSRTLSATVMKAQEYARRQSHRHITLEHLLLALVEDHDAAMVLASCNVDPDRVGTDVSAYLGRLEDRTHPGENADPVFHTDLVRIIEYATAAARQSRRREINGAIVLAAIVGEGRSTAAGILRVQGLTFEEAIKALQRASAGTAPPQQMAAEQASAQPAIPPPPAAAGLPPAARAAPQTAEQILAGARERIEASRQHTAPPAPPALAKAPETPRSPTPSPPPLAPEYEAARPAQTPPAPPAPPRPVNEAASPPERAITTPPPEHAAERPAPPAPPAAAAAAAAAASPSAPPGWPAEAPGQSQPRPMPPPGASRPAPAPPHPGPQPPLAAPASPPPPPSPAPSLRDFERAEVAAAAPLPQPVPSPEPAQRTGPPPLAPAWTPPPQPAQQSAQPLPPRAREDAAPPRVPRPANPSGAPSQPPPPQPYGYPQQPEPQTGAPGAPRQPSPPPWQPPGDARARPVDPLAQPLGPPMPQGAARPMPPGGQPRPPGPPPQQATAPPRPAPATGSIPGLADGQLVEKIPRKMRVGIPETVEIRIAKADVQNLSVGIEGRGAPMRHDLIVTRAMSVRLRAPDGGFAIDPASPETQWIENRLGLMSDDYASWRWTVTPLRRGPARLQLVVAAKTVGTDGLAADTALPDQVIEIAISTNYRQSAVKWGGWAAAAVIGGLLSRFGESIVTFGSSLIGR